MIGTWIRWEPVKGLSGKYCVDAILKISEGLIVELSRDYDEKKSIKLIFDNSVYAYRNIEESFVFETYYALKDKYGKEFYQWAFFKVTNSPYMTWLSKESNGTSETLSLTHFSIVTADILVDIVAVNEPTIEFIE